MKTNYLNIYNNLIKLTRNKLIFDKISKNESFSDRLVIFFIHFAFFLQQYKKNNSKDLLQDIYDFNFKQLEISIRELGYGDMSINKKMKDYINLFHLIITKIENWENFENEQKSLIFIDLFDKPVETDYFVKYFEKYRIFLSNNTLNSFSKDIINFKI